MFSFSTFGVRGLGHFAPKFAFSYGLKNSIGQPAVHFFTQIITYPEFPNTKNYVISASPEFRNTKNYAISASPEFPNTENYVISASPEFPNTENYAISASPEFPNTENYAISASPEFLNTENCILKTQETIFLTNFFTLNNKFYGRY